VKRDLGGGYELDDDRARLDREAVHAYLGGESYWAAGRTRERQDELIDASSRVVGLYREGRQIGFARAADCDAAGFVYLADVYVLGSVSSSSRRSSSTGRSPAGAGCCTRATCTPCTRNSASARTSG
jgi:hypothetical protein